MTLRDSRVRSVNRNSEPGNRKSERGLIGRLRDKRRRKERRLLSESLEQRQLLAGPDLIGIQPNEGSLLNNGSVLNISPRELVFRFDDNSALDPATLSAIQITRAGEDGAFESATATSDLGTNGQVLVEFRAVQSGSLGNGIKIKFSSSSRVGSTAPIISVDGRTIFVDVNSNPNQPTRVQDLVSAIDANPAASQLVEAIQVSGNSLTDIGTKMPADGLKLTLIGANSAQTVTDFGTNGAVFVRFVSQLSGADGRGTEIRLETRNFGGRADPVVLVTGQSILVQLNSARGFESTAADLIWAINNSPSASTLVSASFQQGDVYTRLGLIKTPFPTLTLAGASDEVVEPGFRGLGDSAREVIFRFAKPLPQDLYQIDILGSGPVALRNVAGELFQDGRDLTRQFEINLGPKVVAVVPEPVRRTATGGLSSDVGKIEVHFNDDDLNVSLAQTPSFYQLIFTRDTVDNTDDVVVTPTTVVYNSVTNIATLDFARPLSRVPDPASAGLFLSGAARLRVGTTQGLPAPPTEVALMVDPGDTFDAASDLGTIDSTQKTSTRVSSEIFNTVPFGLDLPGPDLPGTRDIRPDDPTRLLRTVPLDYLRLGADVVDGISVVQYNFPASWLGDDPNRQGINEDKTYLNVISEQQKQRVREVLQLYSEYLGINFVEVEGAPTSAAFFSIAVGDLYGGDETAVSADGGLAVVTRDRNGDGVDDLAVLDFQDFDESIDDQFGGEFFRGAMFAVGQLIGYGYADDLPQPEAMSMDFILNPGSDTEAVFPSLADIVHGQFIYRPDSTDIDLYRFTLETRGTLSIETLAERLEMSSLLDTALRLYRLGSDGSFHEIAQNDDYFSNDSMIEVEVDAGTYIVGVSARGNTTYDPTIESSGFGGLTEGEYKLQIDFQPTSAGAILDTTGVALDGDGDNRPGGIFNFWFVPSDVSNTLYVDKAASATAVADGTLGNPYREIDMAIAAAVAGDTIRVVGNGGVDGRVETVLDNYSYQIGFAGNQAALADGSTLNLPQGVRMVIDSGAILKLSGARIGIGSVSPLIDVSDSALQVLGTPSIITAAGFPARDAMNAIIPGSVYFTSLKDTTLGMGNSATFGSPNPGDWGGIDFRGDLDSADESRRNRELEGVFLNHIQFADLRYGGGSVSIGGRQSVVSPIDMAITRPTIINSRITWSADSAMSATPDTFRETRFNDPVYQFDGAFTPDYSRIGPEITGNCIIDNTINGLFIRIATRAGDELEKVTISARFDDTDITHVLTENLVILGTAGGPLLQSTAPSALLIRPLAVTTGSVPAGEYVYRITNVNAAGLETVASQPTVSVTLTSTGGIRLTQLPTVSAASGFVSRRLYRATVDPGTGLPGTFRLVEQLNASATTFTDTDAAGTTALSVTDTVLQSRLDGRLAIDPGTVLKIDGARIEARFGGNLIAEGSPSLPIIFTSLEDQRYGMGGTFDTNSRGDAGALSPGDWGGIYVGSASQASIDQAVIAGGGGTTRIEGDLVSFNAIEVHQGTLRLANSRLEQNADGRGEPGGDRVGRGENAAGTVFVRGSAPVIINNEFINNESAVLSFDLNSLSSKEVFDPGRSTGFIDRIDVVGNAGPLVQGNVLSNNSINAMQIRGGQLATAGVWDDVDIVHVVTESIEIPNQHIFGGLKLQSDARGSLVVKFQSAENEVAGIVVGGNLLTAADQFRDIPDRIGGSLQVVGHPDFPVVLTTLADDSDGAGFTLDGRPQVDTNNDGIIGERLANVGDDGFILLPAGPEVNRGTTIDNDVDINTPGYFEATPQDGHLTTVTGVTVVDATTGLVAVNQDYFFDFATYVIVNGVGTRLSASTVTQPATLIGDDLVESRGTFAGPNGDVSWVAQTEFRDGIAVMFSSLELTAAVGTQLGDVRVVNFFHPDVGVPGNENLYSLGTPGAQDFRAIAYQVDQRFGFGHSGFFTDDGENQQNATYVGWAADTFANLEADIAAATATYSPQGVIDTTTLPPMIDPRLGAVNGPGDVNTAFAWDVVSTASTSTITSFVELIDQDPADFIVRRAESGLWNGIVVREAADDRNVASIAEDEPVRTGFIDTNAIPSQSQFLGEIAPNLQSGDENRRLGFIIDGAVTTRSDVDVYSFVAESGTEVWLDIDRTGNQLDSVVELIDANGRVLASSNDSLLAEMNPAAIFNSPLINPGAAQQLSMAAERLPVQQITIGASIVDATDGTFALSIDEELDPALVPVDAFLLNPANAIGTALQTAFPAELGLITASLLRRTDGDFVVQLQFDPNNFVGRTVPLVTVDTTEIVGPAVTASVAEVMLDSQLQDAYSSNRKDAGMRVQLPGEAGTRNLYHVRVRSSNTRDPLDFDTLNDPGKIRDGLSVGRYQLQIRLSELDEHAGTQMRLTDVRYAVNGLQIIGQPLHSPLFGEEYEIVGDNDSLATAQPLGYFGAQNDLTLGEAGPLQSDKLAKSFGGALDSATDVDWYRFEVNYENLTRDEAALYLSTVFDLDYASGLARADMALYVFNEAGQLILVGGDSNIADDLPTSPTSLDADDLSRGSFDTDDPFIGAAELIEGTYYVAVANQQQVPLPLDQFFNAASANPLLRLEPIDSVTRIAEDHIGSSGGMTATQPIVPLLFDDNSIVAKSFDDALLYVNTATGLQLVNPFTGAVYDAQNPVLFGTDQIRDVAFTANGELFGYSDNGNGVNPATFADDAYFYYRINSSDASLTQVGVGGGGLETFHDVAVETPNTLEVSSDDGIQVEAITIREFQDVERGFLVANRPIARPGLEYFTNILYAFDPQSGDILGDAYNQSAANAGAGTSPREIGQINTDPQGMFNTQLGVTAATERDASGLLTPSLFDGDTFTISNGLQSVTFELEQGFTLRADTGIPVRDGDSVVIDVDGVGGVAPVVFEFNTGARLMLDELAPTGTLVAGTTVLVTGANGQTQNFEFVGSDLPANGNIAIATLDTLGQPRTAAEIALDLAVAINQSISNAGAASNAEEIFFGGNNAVQLTVTGAGVTVVGDDMVSGGAIGVSVSENALSDLVIARLASAIRSVGISVSASGTELALPNLTAASTVVLMPMMDSPLELIGTPGVTFGNTPILLLPTDDAATLALRISLAVDTANTNGDLMNVTAIPDGRSLSIVGGGFVQSVTGNLVAGGLSPGGLVQGIELVDDTLYAVSDAGGLYSVDGSLLTTFANRQIGTYVPTATDLIGLNFTGLRAGPVTSIGGDGQPLQQILFGITAGGDIYAFNTRGELQPVFAGGRTMISTGIAGALGLDFSTLDFNLWHVTETRGGVTDLGHGIDALDNGTRARVDGGSSLAFNYENAIFGGLYPSTAEQPTNTVRQDGTAVEATYNFPGGAKGVVQSNPFSLVGYAAADEPTLYFNYFSATDGDDDRLRVYVVTESGVEHLVASNNTDRGPEIIDDEFDDPTMGVYDDDIDVNVQQLFDNTNSWRQARVSLGEFAGLANLSLRIEFSTSGTTESSSPSIRAVAGDQLFEGQQIVVGGETFAIDLTPAVSVPTGHQLAMLYADPAAVAVVTIDGQSYVLNDGTRPVLAGQVSVDLPTPLSSLLASEIATALAESIRTNPPSGAVITGLSFDDPPAGSNDFVYEATVLPYNGGNATLTGSGRIGDVDMLANPINTDDVDLLSVEVAEGATIRVSADSPSAAIRFFDANGNSLISETIIDMVNGTVNYTATADGPIFIGISGVGNEGYDPRVPGTAQPGQLDFYTATIAIEQPLNILTAGNLVELNGAGSVTTAPTSPFTVSGQSMIDGIPIEVSRFMTASEVAIAIQRSIADRFFAGQINALPTQGATLTLPSLMIQDSGPFVSADSRFGDAFTSPIIDGVFTGTNDNVFEGVYLDDFIIGFAERGEIATSSNVVDTAFVTDGRPQFPSPADPVSNLVTGSYQVEIRDASEYVASLTASQFRTFDTNDRLTDSRTITAQSASELSDGLKFSISDGRTTVTFEFDQLEKANGVTPGNVRIPFTLLAIEPGTEEIDAVTGLPIPGTGTVRPETASEVAANIVAAINRADVQSLINVPALLSGGIDSLNGSKINLFGKVIVNNLDGALASVGRSVLRGDSNRDRDSQGEILIESSQFLYNLERGVIISGGLSATVNGVDTPSIVRYPRNLVELNTESLKPGVVLQSSVLAFNTVGGLLIEGIPLGTNDTASDPVPYDRIVNNTIIGGSIEPGAGSSPGTFQGVLFPSGIASFADAVVDYSPGSSAPTSTFQNSANALGAPDGGGRGAEPVDGQFTVSLGLGGSLTLQFTDNLLTGSGDSRPDLIVFETGAIESVQVAISRDGVQFENVGTVGGLMNTIDIDAFGFGTQDRFAFVRLTDLRQGRTDVATLGADIDAVGALSSVPVDTYTAGGIGIEITGNAAPAVLNNVIANSETGIQADPANPLPILGANTYYRNTTNVVGISVGPFAQQLSDAEVIFVDAANLLFAPAPGALIIDSSIDSLEDRASLIAVKNPLGLPPSPILAPRLDVNGQLRVDDPNVETPRGLGERIFKDRGASDRGDLVGPRAVLLTPQAPGTGVDTGAVSVFGAPPQFFEVQLIDGIAPADVVPGIGVDDRSVSSGSVLLLKDNVPLIEGVDYRFGYNPSTNVIRLTPIAGVWEPESTYVIRFIDAAEAIVQAFDGNSYVDGGILNIRDATGTTTRFEYETGITMTIASGTLVAGNADGIVFSIFDGKKTISFELDSDDELSDPLNFRIPIPVTGNDTLIAQAIADAVNYSVLKVTAIASGSAVQFLGSNPLTTVTSTSTFLATSGAIGTQIGFGIQIPTDGAGVAATLTDGQTFTISRGTSASVTFEFDVDHVINTEGATPVRIPVVATLDHIADAIVRAIRDSELGLEPFNAGFGRVALGGDANYSLDVTDSTLIQLGFPGDEATVPIVVGIDETAAEVAQTIAAIIDWSKLPGVSTTVVDTRVFLDGTGGTSGIGAVDPVIVRDEVGNLLQSNQADGGTELTVFVGGGFDYGDAPAPYISLDVDGGPRHAVDPTFSFGAIISADSDARLPNADDDDGITIGTVRSGFATSVTIVINNTDDRRFYVDAWFDWDADGRFESDEMYQYGSLGTGRSLLATGTNTVSIPVPAGTPVGETFARFRLSEESILGPTGDTFSGEVEDYRIIVTSNQFQNPLNRFDVNASGATTPLDALQIVNAIRRNGGDIMLDGGPLPPGLPMFADVNGNGIVSSLDALYVINELGRIFSSGEGKSAGEGEATPFVSVANGVMASGATVIGDTLIAEALPVPDVAVTAVESKPSKASVFDNAAVVELDSIVDVLAEDASTARPEEEADVLDRLFASF